jgi:hypothetical protein
MTRPVLRGCANGASYASGVYRFTNGNTKLKVSTAVQQRPKQVNR